MLISLMLGLLFGGVAAFAREHLDDTFKSPEDVEENLGLPLLGIIPLAATLDDPIAHPHRPALAGRRGLPIAAHGAAVLDAERRAEDACWSPVRARRKASRPPRWSLATELRRTRPARAADRRRSAQALAAPLPEDRSTRSG